MPYPDIANVTVDFSGHSPAADGKIRGFDPDGDFVVTPPPSGDGWNVDIDFESIAIGGQVTDSGGVSSVPNDTLANTSVQVGRGSNSSKVARIEFDQGTYASNGSGLNIDFPSDVQEGGHIWFQCKSYFPAGFDFTAPGFSLKFMRIHTVRPDGSNGGYLDLYIRGSRDVMYQNEVYDGNTVNNPEYYVETVEANRRVEREQVQTWTMHAYLSDSNPIFELWLGNNLIVRNTDWRTVFAGGRADRALIFTYWNGSVPANQNCDIDDIKLSSDSVPSWATSLEGIS